MSATIKETQIKGIKITEDTHLVFYGNHDMKKDSKETDGMMIRDSYEDACRTANLLEECGYQCINIRRAADLNE